MANPKYFDPDTGKEVQPTAPIYVDPDTGEPIEKKPAANTSSMLSSPIGKGVALAIAATEKGAELASKGVSAAIHHPLDTAASLAAGKYLSPNVAALLKRLPGADTVKYLPEALKDTVGYLTDGASALGGALSRGAGTLASAASEGADSMMPLVLTQQQARDAINAQLRAKSGKKSDIY